MDVDFGKLKILAKELKTQKESKNDIADRAKKVSSDTTVETGSSNRAHIRQVNNGITLTDEQYKACRDIETWFFDTKKDYKTLSGFAGTGKTTSLDAVVDMIVRNNLKVLVTATTNKAVKVLKEKITHPQSHFRTIHSALNIVPKQVGEREVFEPAYGEKFVLEDYNLVIIDECSMISKVLLGYIDDAIENAYDKPKVLFCGDPAQLQPINETISQCFDFDPVTLKNIVRHGDVIANKSKLVRSTDKYIPFDDLLAEPDISLIEIDQIKEMVKGFRDNPDKLRMLCWTNRAVNRWNHILRLADYNGEKTKHPYEVGDILMANEPCIDRGGNVVMMNSQEGKVISMVPATNSYYVTLMLDTGKEAEVCIIRDKYKPKLKSELNSLATRAKAGEKKLWKDYWALRKSFHDVRHCYAITSHKSQGSTFQNVVIDADDINLNSETEERNQLVYVAMTRASDNVWIFE